MNTEQRNALQEQVDIHRLRLKTVGTELQKEGIQKLIDDLEEKLLKDADDRDAEDHLQMIIDDHKARLKAVKKNPSTMPVIVDEKSGRILKTKGDIDIEGFQKSIEDHQAQLEKFRASKSEQ